MNVVPVLNIPGLENDPQQISVRALFMRGGSSRGAFFFADDRLRFPIHSRAKTNYGGADSIV